MGDDKGEQVDFTMARVMPLLFTMAAGGGLWFGTAKETFSLAGVGELRWAVIVTAVSVLDYEFMSVMGSGLARRATGLSDYVTRCKAKSPPGYGWALRAQMNQLEQLVPFYVSLWAYALFVNATAAGVLGGLWLAIRFMYGIAMRADASVSLKDKGVGKYTIPCYFIVGGMATAACIQALLAQ